MLGTPLWFWWDTFSNSIDAKIVDQSYYIDIGKCTIKK